MLPDIKILIQEALLVKTGKEFDSLIKEKYGVDRKISCIFGKMLKGTGYRTSKREFLYVYKDIPIEEYDIKMLSYYIGYFAGDGTYRGVFPALQTTKREFFNKLKEELPLTIFKVKKSIVSSGEEIALESYSHNFKDFINDIGFPVRKSVTDFELDLSIIELNKVEFVAGLIDSDGTRIKKDKSLFYFSFITSSKSFYKQLMGVILFGLARELKGNQGKNMYIHKLVLSNDFARKVNNESKYLNKKLKLS